MNDWHIEVWYKELKILDETVYLEIHVPVKGSDSLSQEKLRVFGLEKAEFDSVLDWDLTEAKAHDACLTWSLLQWDSLMEDICTLKHWREKFDSMAEYCGNRCDEINEQEKD